MKSINQSIENYKQQLEYIKAAKNLKKNFDKNPNDLAIKTILKAFAFNILQYTSQLKDIKINKDDKNYDTIIRQKKSLKELSLLKNSLDSEGNYQMFYGARYLDNVKMAMFFCEKSRISYRKKKKNHIPISISKAFDGKINFPFHDYGTIGGSADGYVAVFDNDYKSKSILYITNILTGESVTVLDVKNWIQPVFWKKKLIFFPIGNRPVIVFNRNEFMKNPDLSLGEKIPTGWVLGLPDSLETHHTGKLFFTNIDGTIKEFDVESEKVINEIQKNKYFYTVSVFGKEKLNKSEQFRKYQKIISTDLIYLSKPTGVLFKQDPLGEYKEILRTDIQVSSMILSNKNPDDYSKALMFSQSKIFYGKKSCDNLRGIPIRYGNMVMRLYSNVYYIMNSFTQKLECRRIFFDEDIDYQIDNQYK